MPSEELQQQVLAEYAHAAFLADPSRLALWEELGLTMAQLRTLYVVREEGRPTASRIAGRLGVRPSTGTGVVDGLIALGLVGREGDEVDRRVVRVVLTPAGDRVVGEFTAASRAFIRTILQELDERTLQTLFTGLARLNREAQDMGLQVAREIPALDFAGS